MKIALITISHRGDDPRLYDKIARSLTNVGEVRIFTPISASSDGEITIQQVDNTNRYTVFMSLYQQALSYHPRVVICVEPLSMLVGIALRMRLNCQLIYDCHEFFAQAFAQRFTGIIKKIAYASYYYFENILASRMNHCITVNDLLAERLKEANKQTIVCANYPRQDGPVSDAPREYDLIYVGGISADKGMLLYLEALHLLADREIKMLFIGKFISQQDKELFKAKISELGLASQVSHIPWMAYEAVRNYLQKAKIGLCMHNPAVDRYQLALPLKLLDYLQNGLAVVTNKYPIIEKIINAYPAGICVPYHTVHLARAIKHLLSKPLDDYILAGQRATAECYNWEQEEKKLLELFINKKRLLIIAYFYPPLGGPGVQRPLKLIKTMANKGWSVDVITVRDITFHSFDHTLAAESAANLVIRTSSLDPMAISKKAIQSGEARQKLYFGTSESLKKFIRNAFFVDDKIAWFPMAYKAGITAHRQHRYDAVMATMGPYTGGLVAAALSKKFNIPLVLDYRDHWTLNPYIEMLTPVHSRLSTFLENKILSQADLVTVVGSTMKHDIHNNFGAELNIHTMYNGYDEDDFTGKQKQKNKGLQINYIGNFYGNRSPEYFVKALLELSTEGRLPLHIAINFIGNYYPQARTALQNPLLAGIIKIIPQLEHTAAVQAMLDADILLLFIATPRGEGVITGKIFEYLRAGAPILAMIPPAGEAAQILTAHQQTHICPMENVTLIKENFISICQHVVQALSPYVVDANYSREAQSVSFVSELEKIL